MERGELADFLVLGDPWKSIKMVDFLLDDDKLGLKKMVAKDFQGDFPVWFLWTFSLVLVDGSFDFCWSDFDWGWWW